MHLLPFEAAVRTAGAESVMNAYHDIDGLPCASAEWLLTDVLRGEWGFDGTVVSDYGSVEHLRSEHGVAAGEREAGVAALEAGIDVELPFTNCYGEHLVAAVETGELAEETLDRTVRRVLRAKFRKGSSATRSSTPTPRPTPSERSNTAISARASPANPSRS